MPPPPRPAVEAPWSLRAVAPTGIEVALVHAWMREPHVERWWHQAWTLAQWSEEVAQQAAGTHSRPWLLSEAGAPVAYVEAYRVARDVIAEHHPIAAHDLGIHLAIGDPDRTGRGLGPRVLRVVADGLLAADPACRRVVGDPAAGHAAARGAFAAAGFALLAEVDLGHKRAALMAYDRPGERASLEPGL